MRVKVRIGLLEMILSLISTKFSFDGNSCFMIAVMFR